MKRAFFLAVLMNGFVFANPVCDEVKSVIAALESKNDYTTLSNRGFVGKYQFGAMRLVDIGLVDGDKYTNATFVSRINGKEKVMWKHGNHKTFLADKQNWRNGLSLEAFLASEKMQEEAMDRSCEMTIQRLNVEGIDTSDKSALKASIAAAHLGGVDSVVDYIAKDTDYSDAYGTKLSKYFEAGAGSKEAAKKAKAFLGSRYVWGGTTPQGFDCSGYIQYLFAKEGIALPRTAWDQSKRGTEVSIDALASGDLLFFLTDKKRGIPVTHVGIYQGNGKFAHAASKKQGVIISELEEYRDRFVVAKRITKGSMPAFTAMTKNEARATSVSMKIALHYDLYVLHNGMYVRQSQLIK